MSMHPSVARAFDEIDAAAFSGDTFLRKANREKLRTYVGRWTRFLAELDADDLADGENDPEDDD